MGREHELAADLSHRLVERLTVGDAAVEQLEDQEPGVALVEVEDTRREPEGGERPRPTDAEHQLLLDAMTTVAAVEPISDPAILR
jgi:hypothetical protein